MYKWKIDVSLKNGENIVGLYESKYNNSMDVGKELLEKIAPNCIFTLASLDGKCQIFIITSEVAAMLISIAY